MNLLFHDEMHKQCVEFDLAGLFPIARIPYTLKKRLAFRFKESNETYNLSVMDWSGVDIYADVLLATFQLGIICRTMSIIYTSINFLRG
jgi:hypothetical protein